MSGPNNAPLNFYHDKDKGHRTDSLLIPLIQIHGLNLLVFLGSLSYLIYNVAKIIQRDADKEFQLLPYQFGKSSTCLILFHMVRYGSGVLCSLDIHYL
jgi:hypothetical protein